MHWAFDKGMITIDYNLKVVVHKDVDSDYLRKYNHKQIFIPEKSFFQPDVNNFHYHQNNVFGFFKTSGSLVKAPGYGSNTSIAYGWITEDSVKYEV